MEAGVVLGALVPHPPVLVPEVGGAASEVVSATAAAMERLGRALPASRAEALAVVTPHGPVQEAAACLHVDRRLAGDLAAFGAAGIRIDVDTDAEWRDRLLDEARRLDFPLLPVRPGRLDHGSLVPLYFFRSAGALPRCVVLTPPWRLTLAYRLGRLLARAARRAGRRVAVVASGDLSHRLAPGAPGGYAPEGRVFDERLVDLLRAGDAEGILHFPADLAEAAGQDVLPSLVVLLGALADRETRSEVLSYEGPFGVGYAVAVWEVRGPRREAAPVRAARRALELHLREGLSDPREVARRVEAEMASRRPAGDPDPPAPAAGVFVSLKKGGELRGCTGTVGPPEGTLLEEIARVALASAERDPRFPPVRAEELDELDVTVDVLEPPEPVAELSALDPRRYGVIVEKGKRRGLLLPDLPGITTAERQYALACGKAGLDPSDPEVVAHRFRTRRYR